MKRAKLIPSILMLIAFIAVLGIGIYAASPVTNPIQGTITINGSGYLVSLSLYSVEEDGERHQIGTTQESRGIMELSLGDMTFDLSEANILSEAPTCKFVVVVENKSSVELGAYFLNESAVGAIETDGVTAQGITTRKDFTKTIEGQNVTYASANLSYYKQMMPATSTNNVVEMDIEISVATMEYDIEKTDINIPLNIEKYNPNVTTQNVPSSALTNNALIKLSSSYDSTTRSEITSTTGLAGVDTVSNVNVVIPQTVETIGNDAFAESTAFNSLYIPKTVTSIGADAISSCTNLSTIVVDRGTQELTAYANSVFATGNLILDGQTEDAITRSQTQNNIYSYNTAKVAGLYKFDGSFTPWQTLVEKGSVKVVDNALVSTKNIENELVIDSSITSIGANAVAGNEELYYLTIGKNVTSIAENAFANCTGLKSISVAGGTAVLNANVSSLGLTGTWTVDLAFKATSLTRENILKTYTLTTDYLPENQGAGLYTAPIDEEPATFTPWADLVSSGKVTVADGVFTKVTELAGTLLVVPDEITAMNTDFSILSSDEREAYKIDTIYTGSGVTTVDGNFTNTIPPNLILGEKVQSVEGNIFDYTYYGRDTMFVVVKAGNASLNVTFTEAFDMVTFGFVLNSAVLTDIVASSKYRDNVYEVYEYFDRIYGWTDKASYSGVHGANSTFISWEKLLSDKKITVENGVLTGVNKTIGPELVIDSSVTEITANAFENFAKLEKVTIPNTVTSIGANAFKGCENITEIIIPNTVTSIGANAFSGCEKLTTIILEGGDTALSLSFDSIGLPSSDWKVGLEDAELLTRGETDSAYSHGKIAAGAYFANGSFRSWKNLTASANGLLSVSGTSCEVGSIYSADLAEMLIIDESITSVYCNFEYYQYVKTIVVGTNVTNISGDFSSGGVPSFRILQREEGQPALTASFTKGIMVPVPGEDYSEWQEVPISYIDEEGNTVTTITSSTTKDKVYTLVSD